jgi:hypothetical protein
MIRDSAPAYSIKPRTHMPSPGQDGVGPGQYNHSDRHLLHEPSYKIGKASRFI